MTQDRDGDKVVAHEDVGLVGLFGSASVTESNGDQQVSRPDRGKAGEQVEQPVSAGRFRRRHPEGAESEPRKNDHLLLLGSSGLALCMVLASLVVEPPSRSESTAPAAQAATQEPAPTPTPTPTPTYDPVPVAPAPVVETGPFRPSQILVPALGIVAPVAPVGTRSDGQMEIPEDPAVVGWWEGSALADDEAGNTVLAGHVFNGEWGPGIFSRLEGAKAGDAIELASVDGTKAAYTVTVVERPPKTDFPADRVFALEGPHQIVLATCGNYNAATNHYEDNILVFASPSA